MGNAKAFLTINRKEAGYRPILERITDFGEVEQTLNSEDRILQASRCMECGVPFCHWTCPLGNLVPDWQDLLYKSKWQEAYSLLNSTNNFPEFTGRICPALCERSCVLNLERQPLTIRENEVSIIEHAFLEGYINPNRPKIRTGKKVAIIGSGPAGLAVADVLNQKGHSIVIYEKDEFIGGLLRLGIPDFKLNKKIIDRRLNILKIEGITFKTHIEVGKDISVKKLLYEYDAICLAIGSGMPRDLPIEGRNIKNIYFALDFLKQQNRIISGQEILHSNRISAEGKEVLIIGGGDTGADCAGTAIRQRARKVTQIEILARPPIESKAETLLPISHHFLKTSTSHEEGCKRRWSLAPKQFIEKKGKVVAVKVMEVEHIKDTNNGCSLIKETGKIENIKADLVLLAIGFKHPVHEGLLDNLGVKYDSNGNVEAIQSSKSSVHKVYIAGDVTSGASLVVNAIVSGRKAAKEIHYFLSKK